MLRYLKLRYLAALGLLVKARLLFRHNGLIASRDFAFTPKRRKRARLSPSIGASASRSGGSVAPEMSTETAAKVHQIPERQIVSGTQQVPTSHSQAKSAPPSRNLAGGCEPGAATAQKEMDRLASW
jgi:hypothetical protein